VSNFGQHSVISRQLLRFARGTATPLDDRAFYGGRLRSGGQIAISGQPSAVGSQRSGKPEGFVVEIPWGGLSCSRPPRGPSTAWPVRFAERPLRLMTGRFMVISCLGGRISFIVISYGDWRDFSDPTGTWVGDLE
jgi:hypothetical protein